MWQPEHGGRFVTLSTFCRSVPTAVARDAGVDAGGGWPSGRHITLRVKNTPRLTRRVVVGPECEAITPGSVKMPSLCAGSRSTSFVVPGLLMP